MKRIISIERNRRYLLALLFNIAFAIVVPLAMTFQFDKLSKTEATMIGFGIFSVLAFAQTLFHVQELRREKDRRESVWEARNSFDSILKELRDNFSAVVQARSNNNDLLFEQLLLEDVQALNAEAKNAAYAKVLPVKDHHFRSHNSLEQIFGDADTNIYREAYILEEAAGSFDHVYVNFFKMIASMVAKGELEVRTLFVRGRCEEFLNRRGIQDLLCYYHTTKGFDMRIIRQHRLEKLRAEFKVGDDWEDFGIYGDHLVFKTHQYRPDGPTDGLFSKNDIEVRRFLAFFDKAWEDSRRVLPNCPRKVSIQDLFVAEVG